MDVIRVRKVHLFTPTLTWPRYFALSAQGYDQNRDLKPEPVWLQNKHCFKAFLHVQDA
jgi:hypothetical protein